MSISRLITKELGTSIHNFRAKNILNYNLKNKEIATVDFVKGFSEKKGNFEVYSFRDVRGKLIGRETIYDDIADARHIVKDFHYNNSSNNFRGVDTTVYDSVCLENLKQYQDFYKLKDGRFLSTKETIYSDGKPSEHLIEGLEVGKKKTWLRALIDRNYNLTQLESSKENPFMSKLMEYFPLLSSNRSPESLRKRIDYIEKIESSKLDIPNLISSKIEIKKPKKCLYGITAEFDSGHCNPITGKITIVEQNVDNNRELLETVSHELQHRKDFSDMARMEESVNEFKTMSKAELESIEEENEGILEFFNNSVKRGVIPSNSEETKVLKKLEEEAGNYDELCTQLGHDNLEIEKRAIEHGANESKKYDTLLDEVINYLFKRDKVSKFEK